MTDYETWYTPWMKQLALYYTRAEIERQLHGTNRATASAADAHHRAVSATTGMASQSARRARARQVVAGSGDRAIALRGALEIYDEHPQHTKEGKQ